ncbi:hypothetical protein ACA910_016618 [Epithemia clementina (nom. ined.)]
MTIWKHLSILALCIGRAACFAPHIITTTSVRSTKIYATDSSSGGDKTSEKVVEMSVDLPPTGSGVTAIMKIKPILSVPSEFVVVRYSLPFELSVEPKNNLALCTKSGTGGERVGDVLRFTSQWTLGLPMDDGGLAATANAFAGGLKWGCTMFDVMAAKDWRQVVQALTTNTPSRTDEVVLIFERPLENKEEESA